MSLSKQLKIEFNETLHDIGFDKKESVKLFGMKVHTTQRETVMHGIDKVLHEDKLLAMSIFMLWYGTIVTGGSDGIFYHDIII